MRLSNAIILIYESGRRSLGQLVVFSSVSEKPILSEIFPSRQILNRLSVFFFFQKWHDCNLILMYFFVFLNICYHRNIGKMIKIKNTFIYIFFGNDITLICKRKKKQTFFWIIIVQCFLPSFCENSRTFG